MSSIFLPFPWPLSTRQNIYLFGMQGLTAMAVDFGANFGIAYAMYHGQDVVKMWVFSKNTIAGDLGVTPFIQCAASMVITSTLVHTDLHHSAVKPLPFVYPHVAHLPDPTTFFSSFRRSSRDSEKERIASTTTSTSSIANRSKGFVFYWLMLVRFVFEGTENNMLFDFSRPAADTEATTTTTAVSVKKGGGKVKRFFGRLGWTILQGLGIGLLFGFPLWCLAIVILGPIYGNRNMGDVWAPQAIKGVYGGLLGLITNPVIATLALGSQAEHHLIPLTTDGAAAAATVDEKVDEPADVQAPEPSAPSGRPKSGSVSSSRRRPSITANPSHMLFIPQPVGSSTTPRSFASFATAPAPSPSLGPATPAALPPSPLPPTAQTPPHPTANRPRAHTGASEYSLGGTGGRAQRPRSGSRASTTSVFLSPPSGEAPSTSSTTGRDRAKSNASVHANSGATRQIPSAWSQAPPSPLKSTPAAVQRLRKEQGEMEVPRESLELRDAEAEGQRAAVGRGEKEGGLGLELGREL